MKSFLPCVSAFLRLGALVASIATLSAQQSGNSPVKIFIMVGQSNMLGHGNMSPVGTQGTLEYVVANDPGAKYQFVVNGEGDWAVRDDVWIKDQYGNASGLTAGYGSGANDSNNPVGSNIGPELGFGHAMGAFYEEQILIVKAAWGGKSLGNDFLPPSSGPYPPPTAEGDTGFYYAEVLRLVDDAIDNLDTYFPDYNEAGGYEIAGICWHQGWNDRVTPAFSAAYEKNMANFIRDIRTDLGIPDLPFVIATSAMDGNGPATYTQVEIAQRAMTNFSLSTADPPDPISYSDFIGSVAVVDCRQTYDGWAHAGLEFWQDVANSPANQGYHWNRNAKTYLNIGLAMADEMATLAPSPCPSNLQASASVTSGVDLDWLNWDNIPTSVQVSRDGDVLAAALPGSTTSFADTAVDPGIIEYELVFTMPGDPCPPLTVTFDGSITGLEAFRTGGDITLTWTNAMIYPAIEIRRNGVVIEPAYTGTAETYIDTSPLASGGVVYQVAPTTGTSIPAQAQIQPYWDGGSVNIGTDGDGLSDGGSGTWDTTTLNWDEGTAPHVAWDNASNATAIFGGAAGTVTISGGAIVGGVEFETANYIIDGDPLTFATAGDIHNDATATISSDVAGSVGLSKTGNGTLKLTNAAYSFTGDISVGGGTLDFSNGNDGVARSLGGGNFTGDIDIASGATFQFWRQGGTQQFSGAIRGDGDLRLAYNATYTLSGANTYTGKTVFHGEFNGKTATLNVSSFNSVASGTMETGMGTVATPVSSSSLGAPTTVANGTVDIGRGGMQANAILNYTGPGETTDRVMNLVASGTSTKVINNLGSGTLTFTEPWIGNNTLNFRVPITTDADMILTGSLPGNPQYLEKRGNAKLSLEGPCNTWSYVHLFAGTLEIDSEINDGGVYTSSAITTGSSNGGTNFITVPVGTPIEVGMTVNHGRLAVGTTILDVVDINADPVVAEISSNSDSATRTESGSIGFAGALGITNPSAANLRWRGNATLKYDGPDDSTNRAFTIDNNFTSTWEIIGGSTLTVSGGTTNTTGKITKTGAGTLSLSGAQAYTGVTTVSEGTLALVGGSQTSPVIVASGASLGFTLGAPTTSTASVNLTSGTVKITGAVDNSSDYLLMTANLGFTGNPTLNPDITGYELELRDGGKQLWLVHVGSAYSTWATTNAPTGNPDDDYDGDGVSNAVEFVLGGLATTNDLDKLPALTTSGGNMLFTFKRDQDSIDPSTSVEIEVGTDLSAWPASYTVGPDTAGSDAGVGVSQDDPGVGTDTVTLSVVQSPDAKKFARLKVAITP